ncbi:CDP-diacylglycerol diphosphatase [Ktedonospora formicarum]|uniref:CDP-diacylglycerol diphosphatase n=1 Tax=Ktedonospora formicarum TaxID=2778364 RepID=A0A8J3MTM8_9CHLR|nr:CDP-diacylglycerol diphosphatase [Ktedonospora formicarum]GHO48387.1 hypothetical protein KSX_65500 [Ktedonospora formicarum]
MACCVTTDPLWKNIEKRVHDCESDPNHCKWIDPKQGYALSPYDAVTPDLLVATTCVSGIECPAAWDGTTPNYWNFAWTKLALPFLSKEKEKIGMAINAKQSGSGARTRDFDQLHIHVQCIDSTIKGALESKESSIDKWPNHKVMELNSHIGAKYYRVFKFENDSDLAITNLFKCVYYMIGQHQTNMDYQTLIVIKRNKGGFYVLNSDTVSQELNKNGISDGERLLVKC